MSVWGTSSVDKTPVVELKHWAVMELPDGSRHFVGYNATEHEGRASSKIVAFNPDTMAGVTSSGRLYKLVGEPGLEGDGRYVWSRWSVINRVTEAKDVSQEYVQKV